MPGNHVASLPGNGRSGRPLQYGGEVLVHAGILSLSFTKVSLISQQSQL